jgi:hypothetical protein
LIQLLVCSAPFSPLSAYGEELEVSKCLLRARQTSGLFTLDLHVKKQEGRKGGDGGEKNLALAEQPPFYPRTRKKRREFEPAREFEPEPSQGPDRYTTHNTEQTSCFEIKTQL